jgi:hypothetical protein
MNNIDLITLYCRIAVEANLPGVQLSALENMHYINMIRFDDEDETG